ncbi:radical SAM protein [Nannocystaceae bacterium ST9]
MQIRARAESIAILDLSSVDERDSGRLERLAERLRGIGAAVALVRGHGEGTQLRELLDELGPDLVGVVGRLDEGSILALRRSIPDGAVLARLAEGPSRVEDRYFDAVFEPATFFEVAARARAGWTSASEGPPLRVVDLSGHAGPSWPEPRSPVAAPPPAPEPEPTDSAARVLDAWFAGALPTLPPGWVLAGVQLDPAHRGVQLVLRHPSVDLALELRPLDPSARAYATTRDLAVSYRRPRVEIARAELQAVLDPLIAGLREAERGEASSLPERLFGSQLAAPSVARRLRPPLVCIQPWVQMEIVDPSGLVYQCCSEWTKGHRGGFPRRSLLELWNGAEYQAARRAMVEDVDSLCRSICPRLEDRKFAEASFRVSPGAPRFVHNQLRLAEDIALAREEVQARPIQLALCPSTYCNYDCIMCTYGRTPRRDMPDEIWAQVGELLPTLRTLGLLGGEPLANASAMDFLRRWNRDEYPDARVDLVTNGALLGERALKHLGRCRFGSITVSLNAGTPEVYEQVQRGLALEVVLANIDALREHRRGLGDEFRLTLSFVAMPHNIETLQAFGLLAHERDLPIRLLPLTLGGVAELDFYADPDQVARVLGHVRDFRSWVEKVRPAWLSEVRGLEAAIVGEASTRHSPRRLPVLAR